ncbi:MAG TPA: FMN-binding protein [Planctomycetes bacterium]|nr:FMN-binding protein [Planctomycetota bacterium]
MSKIKYFVQQSWLLIVSSFCFGLLLAIANAAWSPIIEQNRINKLNVLAGRLIPKAKDFVPLEELGVEIKVKLLKGEKKKVDVYKAVTGDECFGWTFNAVGPGFQDKIELIIAVDKDFKTIAGFDVLASNESPGTGDKIKEEDFRTQFKAKPAAKLEVIKSGEARDNKILAISGATISSEAVVKIINHYVKEVKEEMQRKGLIGNDKEQ